MTNVNDEGASYDATDELAHEMAEEYAKSTIEGMTSDATDSNGGSWHDVNDRTEGSDAFVDQAVKYLDAAGVLKRSPENPQWVGWDE